MYSQYLFLKQEILYIYFIKYYYIRKNFRLALKKAEDANIAAFITLQNDI